MENQGGKSLRNHAETMETVWKKTWDKKHGTRMEHLVKRNKIMGTSSEQ
jgi:hypothetical protein